MTDDTDTASSDADGEERGTLDRIVDVVLEILDLF